MDPADVLDQIVERLRIAEETADTRVQESIARISEQDRASRQRIEEQNKSTGALIENMQAQMDTMYGALTGDMLHPNGLLVKVKEVDDKVQSLEAEWHQFRSTLRGVGVALGVFAGVAGGTAGAIIQGLFR